MVQGGAAGTGVNQSAHPLRAHVEMGWSAGGDHEQGRRPDRLRPARLASTRGRAGPAYALSPKPDHGLENRSRWSGSVCHREGELMKYGIQIFAVLLFAAQAPPPPRFGLGQPAPP